MEWPYGTCLIINGGTFFIKGSIDVCASAGSMFSSSGEDRLWAHLVGWSGVYLDGHEFIVNDYNKKLMMENSQFRRVILNEVQRINERHSYLIDNLYEYCEETFDWLRDIGGSSKREHQQNSGGMFGAVVKHKVVERKAVVLEPCLNCIWIVFNTASNFRVNGGMGISSISIDVYKSVCELFGLTMTPFVLRCLSTIDQVCIKVLSKKSGE